MTKTKSTQPGPECSGPNDKEKKYNFIYEKIINNDEPDDAVGLIAYGLYKRKKIKFIKDYIEQHGKEPDDKARDNFHSFSCHHIKEYRNRAEQMIVEIFHATFDQTLSETEEQYEEELKDRLRGTTWRNIKTATASTFLTTLLIAVLFFGFVGTKYGTGFIARVFLVEMANFDTSTTLAAAFLGAQNKAPAFATHQKTPARQDNVEEAPSE